MAKKRVRRKKKRVAEVGTVKIQETYNNTIRTITDKEGNVIAWSSAGKVGFKGTKKGTPFAAQQAAEQSAKEAFNMGLRKVDVYVKGPGPGRGTAIRALQNGGLVITSLKDTTPIPHNGCRPPKQRRV